jgi:hypothetical protein
MRVWPCDYRHVGGSVGWKGYPTWKENFYRELVNLPLGTLILYKILPGSHMGGPKHTGL